MLHGKKCHRNTFYFSRHRFCPLLGVFCHTWPPPPRRIFDWSTIRAQLEYEGIRMRGRQPRQSGWQWRSVGLGWRAQESGDPGGASHQGTGTIILRRPWDQNCWRMPNGIYWDPMDGTCCTPTRIWSCKRLPGTGIDAPVIFCSYLACHLALGRGGIESRASGLWNA